VVVQDFVSGRVCGVNQYYYESRKRRVVMRFFHTTGKTWYKVLYKHTMYVISLSYISIKTNFKQITRVEIRLTHLYNTLRETTFYAWRHVCYRSFYCFVNVAHIDVFYPAFQWYDVMTKIVRQRRSRATSRHSFITTVWWYNILYQTPCIKQATFFKFKGKCTKC
jgi:hypothetical protein